MNVSKILITFQGVSKSGRAILQSGFPTKEYVDGKPTEKINGYSYPLVLVDNDYEKLIVRTPELVPAITNEYIESQSSPVIVTPKNFVGRLYRMGDTWGISAKADTMEIVSDNFTLEVLDDAE